MKFSHLFLLLALLVPFKIHSSVEKKQWKSDFERLVNDKDEKIKLLEKEIAHKSLPQLFLLQESQLPRIKEVAALISQCIQIRNLFITQASQIGNSTFQDEISKKLKKERDLCDKDIQKADSYCRAIKDLELPMAQRLINESEIKAKKAQDLYDNKFKDYIDDPEIMTEVLIQTIQLYQEAIDVFQEAIKIANPHITMLNKSELEKNFSSHVNRQEFFKNELASFFELKNRAVDFLKARFKELSNKIVELKASRNEEHCEVLQRRMSGILEKLINFNEGEDEELQTFKEFLEKLKNEFNDQKTADPLLILDQSWQQEQQRQQQFFLFTTPEIANFKLPYPYSIIALQAGQEALPLDGQFSQENYSLYAGQFYRYLLVGNSSNSSLKVTVFSNGAVIHEERIVLPLKETLDWDLYVSENGSLLTPKTKLQSHYGLELRIKFLCCDLNSPSLVLSHKGIDLSYSYSISFDEDEPLYSFELRAPPPWQLEALCKPSLPTANMPLPTTSSIISTPVISSKQQKIDCASEVLENFIEEMNCNPLALAQFVQNEIELSDPFLYHTDTLLLAPPIYRGPFETFITREGSPWEQCILLTWMLQKAGYEAICVEGTPHKLPGEFVERMLFSQLPGDDFISLKYPWVQFYNGKEWISLFPWIKDIQVIEGHDLYGFFPDEYASADRWVKKYLCCDDEIMKFVGLDQNDTAGVLFIRYLEEHLLQKGLSIQDVGNCRIPKKKQYSSWDDFPRPTHIGTATNAPDFEERNDLFVRFKVSIHSPLDPQMEPQKIINSPIMRFADLQGRSLSIYTTSVGNDKHVLHLELPDTWEKESILAPDDHQLTVTVSFEEDKTTINPMMNSFNQIKTFQIVKGTCAALCFQVGHANAKSNSLLGNQLANKTTGHERFHSILSFVGSAYFEKCNRAEKWLSKLHKISSNLHLGLGLAKLSPDTSNGPIQGDPILVFPQVDMQWHYVGQSRRSRFQELNTTCTQLFTLLTADLSSNEHQVLKDIFHDPYAISTVKLLQLAHTNHKMKGLKGPGFLVFSSQSFSDADAVPELAKSIYFSHLPDINLRKIRKQGMSQWDNAKKYLTIDVHEDMLKSNEIHHSYVYMTPGPIASLDRELGTPSYIGMGTFIVHPNGGAALIADGTNHLNGGYGSRLSSENLDEMIAGEWNLVNSKSDFSLLSTPFKEYKGYTPDYSPEPLPAFTLDNKTDVIYWREFGYDTSSSSFSTLSRADVRPEHKSFLSSVNDPVDVVTGAFYIDEIDLNLPGQFPLEVRRNYSSQKPIPGILGYGWKLGFNPELVENDDKLMAAEMDGTVIIYKLNPELSRWEVSQEDNPDLHNFNSRGIGGIANPYHAYIEKNDGYILFGIDGSKRTYVNFLLQKWEDNRGNTLLFSYKNGLLSRIENEAGGFLGFYYDHENRIFEAYSADGRRIIYDYDSKGNLAEVTLPNGGIITYRYDDVHQIVRETKPHGRVLENIYLDGKVIKQLSPVGPCQSIATSATFIYEQDRTLVTDGKGYTTEYRFFQKQIYKVIDPEENKILHSWFIDSASWFDAEEESIKKWEGIGSWPKSLKSSKDKRGLVTDYRYDNKGNPIEIVLTGSDLTGNGVSEISKQLQYNERNLLIEETAGNKSSRTTYDPCFPYLIKSYENFVNEQLVSSVTYDYYPSGLLKTEKMDGSSTHWEYTPQGFPLNIIRKTLTDDPDVMTEFEFNTRGQCIKVTTADSISIFHYDIMGNKEKETVYNLSDKLISEVILGHDLNNEIIWERGVNANQLTYYDYHANGQVKAQRKTLTDLQADQLGTNWTIKPGTAYTLYDYDVRGCKILEIDPRGYRTEMEYDPLCRLSSIKKNNLTSSYTYEEGGQIATCQRPDGAVTKRSYTTNGLLLNEENPDGIQLAYIYDIFGRSILETIQGIVWEITYDDIARKVIRTHRASRATEIREFDARGNEIAFTDADGYRWSKAYDGLDRLIAETNPEGWITKWNYNGDTITCYTPSGERQEQRHEAGNVVESKTFSSDGTLCAQSSRNFIPSDNLIEERSGDLLTKTWINTMGQPLLVYDEVGVFMRHYDPCGNCTETQNNEGFITRFKFDPLNRLYEKTLSDGAIVTYEYDKGSNLCSVKMPGGSEWHADYDLMGRKITEEVCAGNNSTYHWVYTYENGLLSTATDPQGSLHTYTYNLFNRLEEETVGTHKRSYSYDMRGHLTLAEQISNGYTSVERTYDPCRRLATEKTTLNGKTIQESLQIWTPESKTLSVNGHLRHFYYQGGYLNSFKTEGLHFSYAYGLSGLLDHTQTPFGSCRRSYRKDGLPEKCIHLTNSGIFEEVMIHDGSGKIRFYDCSAPHAYFKKEIDYDKRGRMEKMGNDSYVFDFDIPGCGTRTTSPGWNVPLDGLDPYGNILKENIEGILTCNKYDEIGQLILRETNGKFEKLSWDPWGRLVQVETGTDLWKASYDAFGRRLQTEYIPNEDTPIVSTSLYDPSEEFLEIGVKSNEKTFWKVYGNGNLEAVVDESGNSAGLIYDALGNLIGITSNDEVIWNKGLASPYGPRGPPVTVFETVAEFAQAHTWRNHRLDPTGYLWMGARHYDPISGRFLSQDPIGYPITLNLYTYVNGDPINFYDPDGRFISPVYEEIKKTVIGTNFFDFANNFTTGKTNAFKNIDPGYSLGSLGNDLGWFMGNLEGALKPASDLIFPQRPPDLLIGEIPTATGLTGNIAKLKILVPRVISSAARIEENAIKFKSFTKRNFRDNLKRFTGQNPPSNVEAHHIFPGELDNSFFNRGLNVHDPMHGVWVDKSIHIEIHRSGYNAEMARFIGKNKNLTIEQLYEQGRAMMAEFGIEVNFK